MPLKSSDDADDAVRRSEPATTRPRNAAATAQALQSVFNVTAAAGGHGGNATRRHRDAQSAVRVTTRTPGLLQWRPAGGSEARRGACRRGKRAERAGAHSRPRPVSFGASAPRCSGDLLPPSPPAEKASARQEETWKPCAHNWARNSEGNIIEANTRAWATKYDRFSNDSPVKAKPAPARPRATAEPARALFWAGGLLIGHQLDTARVSLDNPS
jgi:hypothetical protein